MFQQSSGSELAKLSRRQFLQRTALLGAAALSMTALAGCPAAAPAAAVTSGGRNSRIAARKSSCSQAIALE